MNWGKGIAIALAAFIIFIVVLAVKLMSSKIDLESEDYYRKEIDYQKEIEAQQNANALSQNIKVSLYDDQVLFEIPDSINMENVKIKMTRPNNKELDKEFDVEGTKTFLVPKNELEIGLYNISISYSIDGIDHLQKEELRIK